MNSARLAAAVVGTAVAALAVTTPATAAPTAALGQCTTTRGTIVAVDFGHWGGPVVRGCGVQSNGQPDASGYVLLYDGGFTTTGTTRDGPTFICRIGSGSFADGAQYPTPEQEPCAATPPASSSWSFWLAPPGATSWHYSDNGAASDHPVAGGVELWTFGGSPAPASSLIDQLRAHDATPAGGSPPTTRSPVEAPPSQAAHPGTTSGHGSTGVGTTRAASSESAGASASPRPTGPSGSATASRSVGASGSAASGTDTPGGSPSIVAAQASPTSPRGSGSAVPVVITAVVVFALGGLGALSFVRRRRRAGD